MTPATLRSFTLRFDERPPLLNRERRLHHYERARIAARWRAAFTLLALEARIPRLDRVRVQSWPVLASRRSIPDCGAWFPATKSAIDGIVDSGALSGDGPDVVVELVFGPPQIGDRDALVVVVEEVEA